MALANHVHRVRGSGRYHARLRVPKDLIEAVGKRELWQSLKTTNPETAKREKARIVAGWRSWFDDLRRGQNGANVPPLRDPTDDDMRAVARRLYRDLLDDDQSHRITAPIEADLEAERQKALQAAPGDPWATLDYLAMRDAPKLTSEARAVWKAELLRHVASGEVGSIETVADAYIDAHRFNVRSGTTAYRQLCHLLQRAALQALDRIKERDEGKHDGRHTDPILDPPAGKPDIAAEPGQSVIELYEQYAIESGGKITPDTITQNRKLVRLFAEHFGISKPASAIDKNAVREWKRALFKWPRKAAEIKEFKGLTFTEVLERNKALKKPPIEHRTVNKYLSALGALCDWLVNEGYLNDNPVDGLHLPLDRDKTKVRSYTTEQLTAIFTSPVFTGAASDEEDDKPGKHKINDWRRWLPLVALFTGARLGELAQLQVDDVRQQDGRWIIHITREGDDAKTTKTKGSQRVVPLHSTLVRCGFLKYHAAMKARGEKWLFPTIERDTRGQISGKPSRWYGRYLASIGVKTDKTINFHSYRHGMADALRRAGYVDEQFKFLLGHTQATTTGRYGILPEGELQHRVRLIESVKYPGLSLKHLYRSNI